MEKHDQEFITALIAFCNDRLDFITEFDSLADSFAALFRCHERMAAALPATAAVPPADKADIPVPADGPVVNARGEELTGAALEANRVINSILEQYKKKTASRSGGKARGQAAGMGKAQGHGQAVGRGKAQGKGQGQDGVRGGAAQSKGRSAGGAGRADGFAVSLDDIAHPQSVYADYYDFAALFTETRNKEQLFQEFLNPESEDHDTLFENMGIFTHVQTVALNRQIIRVTPASERFCDLNNLLNTCDVLSALPCWNVVLDLSGLKECGPVEGLMFSRLTLVRPDRGEQPFTSAAADEAFFLEEPALALLIDGSWESIGMGALLDNDRTVSDLVRELAFHIGKWTYDEGDIPSLYEREQLPEPDWDETEHIIDPALSKDRLATALYHAFRYLVHVITHSEQLVNAEGEACLPVNYSGESLPGDSDRFIQALKARLNCADFTVLTLKEPS